MAGEVTVTAINGIGKKVYDKSGLKNWLPSSSIMQKRASWEKGTRNVGESYSVSVVTRRPNGVTYSGSAGGVNALLAPRNMVIKQALIVPFEMELREQFSWAALSRAASDNSEGAFAQAAGEGL